MSFRKSNRDIRISRRSTHSSEENDKSSERNRLQTKGTTSEGRRTHKTLSMLTDCINLSLHNINMNVPDVIGNRSGNLKTSEQNFASENNFGDCEE